MGDRAAVTYRSSGMRDDLSVKKSRGSIPQKNYACVPASILKCDGIENAPNIRIQGLMERVG